MERELSVTERVMWMSHQVGCSNCLFAANVSGNLDESALRTALDWLTWRHPMLRTRIEVRGQTPFFVSDGVARIPLRVRLRQGDDDWHAEAERELNDRISMSASPMLRAVLVKSDDRSDVILVFHHLIADGRSGLNLIIELLELTAQITDGNLSPRAALAEHPPFEEMFPGEVRGLSGFLKTAGFIGRQLATAVIQRPSKMPKDSDAPPSDCRARFVHHRLSAEETQSLRVRCRNERTTIQGAVSAAIMKAVAGQIHNGHADAKPMALTCASAVDLRSALSRLIKDEVGNFASIVVTAHQISPHTAFWKLATAVRDDVMRAIARSEPAVSLGVLKFLPRKIKPADLIKRIAKFNSPIMATNLGVFTLPERFGSIALHGLHVAVAMTSFPENVTAIIATCHNQLEMSFCYSQPTVSRQRITRVMEDTIGLLQTAASLPTDRPTERVAADVTTRSKSFPAALPSQAGITAPFRTTN